MSIVVVFALVFVAVFVGIILFHAGTGLLRLSFDGGAPGLVGAGFREMPAFLRIAWWGVVARKRTQPEDVEKGAEVVVVFVHGALADGTCTTGWRRAVEDAGVDAPALAPDHGMFVRSLEVHTRRLRSVVDRLRRTAPDVKLVFVAHSMGGLVIRRLLADDDDVRAATVGAVTVASPHAGTAFVRFAPFWVGHLRAGHSGFTSLPPLSALVKHSFVVASAVDAICYPKASCLPDGSECCSFDDVGHAAFLVRDDVARHIAALVKRMVDGVTTKADAASSAA